MAESAPPKRPYDVFAVQHARASWIKLNLEDYFKDKEEDEGDSFLRFIFFDMPPEDKNKDPQLGNKRKLRFIADNDTSTIIVLGADSAMRETIRELITLWDVPEPVNNSSARYTKMMKVKYSKAESIVEAIKDAYRDLLSSNDKTFQEREAEGGDGRGKSEAKRDSRDRDSISGGAMNFSFSGKLSLGVDKVTNTILVSAQGEDLLKIICDMIEELDDAAKPTGALQVIKLDGGDNSKGLEKALKAIMGSAAPQDPQQQAQQQQLQQQQQQQQQMNGKPQGGNRGRNQIENFAPNDG